MFARPAYSLTRDTSEPDRGKASSVGAGTLTAIPADGQRTSIQVSVPTQGAVVLVFTSGP